MLGHLQHCIDTGAELPGLEEAAALAHFSPFHFHRLWRALTGETLAHTVKRLRLSRAVQALAGGGSVAAVSLQLGYGSPQALSRAFRQALGVAPSGLARGEVAAATLLAQLAMPRRQAAAAAPAQPVEVLTLAPLELVALRRRGPFDELDAAFGALFAWVEEAGLVQQVSALRGVPWADHRDVPPQRLLFDAAIGLAVPLPRALPAPLRRLHMDGGRHARWRHVGDYAGLEDATDALLAGWWAASGEALRDAPIHYLFLDDPEQVPVEQLRADILLPLAG